MTVYEMMKRLKEYPSDCEVGHGKEGFYVVKDGVVVYLERKDATEVIYPNGEDR